MSININLALIGSGCLATAIATGLCSSAGFAGRIYFSVHTNRIGADRLAALHPEKVFVADSTQDAVDKSDIVIPAVLPSALAKVASSVSFTAKHIVVHVAAGINIETALEWYGGAGRVLRAVPLPFIAERIGPIVLYGEDEKCQTLFSLMGDVINVPSERDLEVLASITGIMVPYYAIVNEIVGWAQSKGMEYATARDYVCSMNGALSRFLVIKNVQELESHMKENSTPGGMNEQALEILNKNNALQPWRTALDAVGKRYGL